MWQSLLLFALGALLILGLWVVIAVGEFTNVVPNVADVENGEDRVASTGFIVLGESVETTKVSADAGPSSLVVDGRCSTEWLSDSPFVEMAENWKGVP